MSPSPTPHRGAPSDATPSVTLASGAPRKRMPALRSRPVAVVTGASSGIGEATARLLASRGWQCVLVARRENALRVLAMEIDGEVEPWDVADRDGVARATRRILDRHPEIHVLVNSAGVLARGSFVGATTESIEQALLTNYLGGVWVTRGLLDGLRREAHHGGRAHIVSIASIGGTIVFTPAAPYSASKHAQVAFSRSLRAALGGTGVEVHTILPGFVTTPGFPHPKVFATAVGRRFVVGPEHVADKVVRAIERGSAEKVVPWFPYALGTVAQTLFPTLTTTVLASAEYPDDP
jgi:uncharacterized protein